MSNVFKMAHKGPNPPRTVTVGVRVKAESPRDTLEVPVIFTWKRGSKTNPIPDVSESRVYTFVRETKKKLGAKGVEVRTATRFEEVPEEVAQLLANVEFQARVENGVILRGRWLDVRLAANLDEWEKADSLPPSHDAAGVETEPEEPSLLRKPRTFRTDQSENVTLATVPQDAEAFAGADAEG